MRSFVPVFSLRVLRLCAVLMIAVLSAAQPMASARVLNPGLASSDVEPTLRTDAPRWTYRFHVPGEQEQRKFLTYENALGAWPTNTIVWRYNDSGRPSGLVASSAAALSLIESAIGQWESVCGVNFVYQGTTTNRPTMATVNTVESADGVNVIGWAAISAPTTGITGLLGTGADLVEADIALNNTYNPALVSTIVHELGHMLGLRHSDVSGVMMSGPPLTSYSGVGVLLQDDINGCRSMFGMPSTSTPSIAGVAQLSGGGNVAQGTQLCFSGSAAVSACSVGANGQFNCTVPNNWTGTVHLQAGNSRRVAAKRYTTGITSSQTGQDFTVFDANDYSCNLDIDNNGRNEAAIDGAMILRKLIGITGESQAVSTSGACAQRIDANERSDFLDAQNYDIGGGGTSHRDGLVLSRLMRGVLGSQAVNGTGLTWSSVQSNLSSQCGESFQ